MSSSLYATFGLVLLLALVHSSSALVCSDFTTCSDCLTNDIVYGCTWCKTDGSCKTAAEADSTCPGQYLNPLSAITSTSGMTGDARPAVTNVVLRKGMSLVVPINVVIPTRKEIELYYLFDLSGSMGDDLAKLRTLGSALGSKMSQLCSGTSSTSDTCTKYQLGSHVDKNFSPFGSSGDYSFRPEGTYFNFQFNVDLSKFTGALSTAGTKNGNDLPESQLDSMLQVLLCSNWTPSSRHILLLATDDIGHLEGEGFTTSTSSSPMPIYRAASKCWVPAASSVDDFVNKANSYQASYDFPSWHQIKAALVTKNVIPIIAVVSSTRNNNYWDDFISYVGFGGRGALASDSNNILNIIETVYKQVAGTVVPQLLDNGMSKYVRRITPDSCNNLAAGATCPFQITLLDDTDTIGVTMSPSTPVTLIFIGFTDAQIFLTAATCNCPYTNTVTCDGKCNAANTASCDCGKCNCKPGFTGVDCSCASGVSSCPGACSGRGTCSCGVCQCLPGFTGTSCECLDSCPVYNDVQCNGQGSCVCGQCVCNAAYTGTACQCPKSVTAASYNCPSAINGLNCTGHGTCNPASDFVCTPTCSCDSGYSGADCSCSSICKDSADRITLCGAGCNDASVGNQCGTCECGVCKCAPGYDPASNCTCKLGDCPRDLRGSQCGGSDQGTCECGACTCKDGWSGPACNCTTEACPQNCNFPNGNCECGVCKCAAGFEGTDCACRTTDTCPVGTNGLPCSGRGTCLRESGSCGVCRCNPGYAGADCGCISQSCPATVNGTCNGPTHGTCSTDGCGTCTCANSKIVGEACQCDTNVVKCPGGGNCNGHGTCVNTGDKCGVCECDPQYTGVDCGCPLSGCPTPNGLECSGATNGDCITPLNGCAYCQCKPGYNGTDCSCHIQTEKCPKSVNGIVCSGHGNCEPCTGTCTCLDGWTGIDCSVPPADPCANFTTCATCLRDSAYLSKINPAYVCTWCIDGNGPCRRKDAQALSCRSYRQYTVVSGNTTTFDCSIDDGGLTEEQTIGIAAGLGGGLAVAGLAALIAYKVFGMLMDKREWEKFEKGRQASQWKSDNNPLFQSSVKETENPLYVGGSK